MKNTEHAGRGCLDCSIKGIRRCWQPEDRESEATLKIYTGKGKLKALFIRPTDHPQRPILIFSCAPDDEILNVIKKWHFKYNASLKTWRHRGRGFLGYGLVVGKNDPLHEVHAVLKKHYKGTMDDYRDAMDAVKAYKYKDEKDTKDKESEGPKCEDCHNFRSSDSWCLVHSEKISKQAQGYEYPCSRYKLKKAEVYPQYAIWPKVPQVNRTLDGKIYEWVQPGGEGQAASRSWTALLAVKDASGPLVTLATRVQALDFAKKHNLKWSWGIHDNERLAAKQETSLHECKSCRHYRPSDAWCRCASTGKSVHVTRPTQMPCPQFGLASAYPQYSIWTGARQIQRTTDGQTYEWIQPHSRAVGTSTNWPVIIAKEAVTSCTREQALVFANEHKFKCWPWGSLTTKELADKERAKKQLKQTKDEFWPVGQRRQELPASAFHAYICQNWTHCDECGSEIKVGITIYGAAGHQICLTCYKKHPDWKQAQAKDELNDVMFSVKKNIFLANCTGESESTLRKVINAYKQPQQGSKENTVAQNSPIRFTEKASCQTCGSTLRVKDGDFNLQSHILHGKCSKCGSPVQMLPKDDTSGIPKTRGFVSTYVVQPALRGGGRVAKKTVEWIVIAGILAAMGTLIVDMISAKITSVTESVTSFF